VRIIRHFDLQSALSALDADLVDVVWLRDGRVHARLPTDLQNFSRFAVLDQHEIDAVVHLAFDMRNGRTANPGVRFALSLAIDAGEVTRVAFGGGGAAATGALAPRRFLPATRDSLPSPDRDRARQVLVEARLPQGFSADVIVAESSRNRDEPIARAIADQLAAIGVQLQLRFVPFVGLVPAERPPGSMVLARTPAAWHPADAFAGFVSRSRANLAHFASAEFDFQVQRLASMAMPETADVARVLDLLESEIPGVPICQEEAGVIRRRNVELPPLLPDGSLGDLGAIVISRA
jgi:ABC-type transport system substrate-binding protein